ncbi:MAG: bifunctional chorismate mutase/prephenate dehydratase, partial [Lachnospiraceae bacterium]|nr:bifunctional chorismate mutase/prephenate dehydratase [Lachnospiraceae bacterium]
VGDVLDLQMKYSCYTVAELDLPIQHVLLGLPEARLEDINMVYSHPQGLLQCSDFLEKHRNWGQVPMNNTAASAKRLVADGDLRHAAIASEMAGELYGLKVLAENIANQTTGNTTRFIIATGKKIYRKDAGKIRICFECRHATGVLYRLLSNFAFNDLNMTKIESRPIPGRNWEYRFFIDFEGNLDEPRVKTALEGIRREASLCKVLGNF